VSTHSSVRVLGGGMVGTTSRWFCSDCVVVHDVIQLQSEVTDAMSIRVLFRVFFYEFALTVGSIFRANDTTGWFCRTDRSDLTHYLFDIIQLQSEVTDATSVCILFRVFFLQVCAHRGINFSRKWYRGVILSRGFNASCIRRNPVIVRGNRRCVSPRTVSNIFLRVYSSWDQYAINLPRKWYHGVILSRGFNASCIRMLTRLVTFVNQYVIHSSASHIDVIHQPRAAYVINQSIDCSSWFFSKLRIVKEMEFVRFNRKQHRTYSSKCSIECASFDMNCSHS